MIEISDEYMVLTDDNKAVASARFSQHATADAGS